MQLLHVVKPLILSLVFIEAPEEHKLVAGEEVLWQCSQLREGKRKGALAWQDHCVDTLLSKERPGHFKQSLKSPAIFDSRELKNCAMDLHVDDGYVTVRAAKMMRAFSHLQSKIVLKLSLIITVGNSFEHVGALKMIDEDDI